MVAPYAGTKLIPAERVSTAIFIPVTNSLERLKKEVNRRADVVGIFPKPAKPEPNRRAKTELFLGRAGNFG